MTRDVRALVAEVERAGGADPLDLNSAYFRLRRDARWGVRRWNRALVGALEAGLVHVYTDAYDDPWIVRRSFVETVEVLLDAGCQVAIATHDERLVFECCRAVDRRGLGPGRYELQMLLGVREELRELLVEARRPLRVYVPYGERWYEYSVRRLQENPRVAGHVTRALAARVLGRG